MRVMIAYLRVSNSTAFCAFVVGAAGFPYLARYNYGNNFQEIFNAQVPIVTFQECRRVNYQRYADCRRHNDNCRCFFRLWLVENG